MSLLSDLINGKELSLSSGSKMTVSYQSDANVFSLGIGGNSVILSDEDSTKLIRIISMLRSAKQIESGK